MLKKGPGVCEHNQPNLYFVLNTFEFIDPAYTSYLYDGGGLVDIFAVDSKVFPISIFIWETDGNPMPVCSYAIGRKKPARVLCNSRSNQENRRFCTVLPTWLLGILFGISLDIAQCDSPAVLLQPP